MPLERQGLKGRGWVDLAQRFAYASRDRRGGTSMAPTLNRFSEFWPYYLRQHRNPTNRALHFCGTTAALFTFALGCVTPIAFVALPLVGYGPAWVGHFVFEKNRPATFGHPFWSLAADFKMWAFMLSGRLGAELAVLE
jgi:hypothetical protein